MAKTHSLRSLLGVTGFLLFLLGPPRLWATELVVHLIDARKGTAIAGKPVRVSFVNAPRPGYLQQKTGDDGTAVFRLSDPVPEYILIHLGIGGYWEECTPNDKAYSVSDILSSGVSKMGACLFNIPNIDRKYQPKPGEVWFFVVHLSFWEHLIHCGKWGCR